MSAKTIDDLWCESKKVKSFVSLLAFFNDSPVVSTMIIKWRQLYYVTVGTKQRNILIQIDVSEKTASFTARVEDHDTDNRYKLLGTHDKRFTRAGAEKLIEYLNK